MTESKTEAGKQFYLQTLICIGSEHIEPEGEETSSSEIHINPNIKYLAM